MKNILAKQQKSAQIFEFPQKTGAREAAEENFVKDSIKAQEDLNKNTAGLSNTEKELIKENKKLSDNVKKLTDEIKKQSFFKDKAKGITEENAKGITETATGRRQFRTIGDRIGDFKDKAKDFLTPRGFLHQTGIVKRGTGGAISDYLDRGEEKEKYAKARMETQGPNGKGTKEDFYKEHDEQQKIQRKMVKNESVIKGYKDLGMPEHMIENSAAYKTRTQLAGDLAKVDPRVRSEEAAAPTKTRSQGLLDAANTSEADTEAISREETQLELLTKIEENTRPDGKKVKKPEEKSFLSSLLDFFTNKFGTLLANALRMGGSLATGALTMGKAGLGKLGGGMAGKVLGRTAAVAGGLYEGYTAWNEADEKVKSGEITQRQGTVEKGGAVGKGLGTTGGALAGGQLGAMIGTAIMPGVGTAVGGIIGGIVGGLAGGKFGQEIGKIATDGALKLKEGFDEFVKKPFMDFFNNVSEMFNNSIVKPLQDFLRPVSEFFSGMSKSISDTFSNFSIPQVAFTIPFIDKKVSIGPFFPFKKSEKAATPSDAGAGAGSSEFAKTDPRRLDKGKTTSEAFDKEWAQASAEMGVDPKTMEPTGAEKKYQKLAAKHEKAATKAGKQNVSQYAAEPTGKPKTLEELAMIEARTFGRSKPNYDDMEAAQMEFDAQQRAPKAPGAEGKGASQTALDAKFDKNMAKNKAKIAAVPEGDSVRVQGKIVGQKTDGVLGKRENSTYKNSLKNALGSAQQAVDAGQVKDNNSILDVTDQIMADVGGDLDPDSYNLVEKQVRLKLQAGLVKGNGTIVNGKPGDMQKGSYDKMSSKPTIVNEDGTKRLMTPQETAAAKTSMATPTEASAVYNKSAANAGAAIAPAPAPSSTVIAPTTNVSNNTTQIVRLPSRNQDVSLQKYMNSRYGM